MRFAFLAAALTLVGCGKGKSPDSASVPPPSPDPLAARRDDDAAAAYSLDGAVASIADALAGTKKLAPAAGGQAKEALLGVAQSLDTAGAALAEHDDAPPPLAEYRKAEGERTSERQKAVGDALDALEELRDAQGTLDDLASNVPPEHKASLETIEKQTDDAIDNVEQAIGRLGGKVPPEDDQ